MILNLRIMLHTWVLELMKNYLEFLNNKCKKILNIIKFLRGTWWGGHPPILLNIYKAMIRGVMDYACFIYNFSNKKKELTFNRIQYKALRLALGYRLSTPIRVLHAEACEPPLTIRSYFLASKFILKVTSFFILAPRNVVLHFRAEIRSSSARCVQYCLWHVFTSTRNVFFQYSIYLSQHFL